MTVLTRAIVNFHSFPSLLHFRIGSSCSSQWSSGNSARAPIQDGRSFMEHNGLLIVS